MKYSMVVTATLLALALSACEKATVVTPAPVVTTVPVPGPTGATGATGPTGANGLVGAAGAFRFEFGRQPRRPHDRVYF